MEDSNTALLAAKLHQTSHMVKKFSHQAIHMYEKFIRFLKKKKKKKEVENFHPQCYKPKFFRK